MPHGICAPLWLAVALPAVLVGCGGNSNPTAPTAEPPKPDFELRLAASTLSAPNGCTGTDLSISTTSDFSGNLELSCEGSVGLRCDFGALPSLSGGRSAVIGLALSAGPQAPNGIQTVRVRGRSARTESTLSLEVSVARATPLVAAGAMTITGCAGYVEGTLATFRPHQGFLSVYVGAWQQAEPDRSDFCGQTLGRDDGSFELLVPRRCFDPAAPVYLTAGGLQTCKSIPFQGDTVQYVVLFGRSDPC